MLLTYLVDRLHLVDDVLAPPEQARLHKSPSTITDLPIQDSMLGLLSPPGEEAQLKEKHKFSLSINLCGPRLPCGHGH